MEFVEKIKELEIDNDVYDMPYILEAVRNVIVEFLETCDDNTELEFEKAVEAKGEYIMKHKLFQSKCNLNK